MAPGQFRRRTVAPSPSSVLSDPASLSLPLPDASGSPESNIPNTNSVASTKKRKGRGETRGDALKRILRTTGKLTVYIPEGKNRAVGENSQYFITEIGVIARQFLPHQVKDYSEFEEIDKEACYFNILDKFDIDITKPHVKETCEYYLRERFNKYRYRLHKKFQEYPSIEVARKHLPKIMAQEDWDYLCNLFISDDYQKRSAANKQNRSKGKVSHIMGTKSFSRVRHEKRNNVTNEEPDRIELWKICHYDEKEDRWSNPTAKTLYEDMIARHQDAVLAGTPMSADEICDQVLGMRPGSIPGLGYGPKPNTKGRRGNSEASEEARKRAEEARKRAEEAEGRANNLAEYIESQQLEMKTQKIEMEVMATKMKEMDEMLRNVLSQMRPTDHSFPSCDI